MGSFPKYGAIPQVQPYVDLPQSDLKLSVQQDEASVSKGEGGSGFLSSVLNVTNAVLGSGILGLAFAMRQSGIIMFLLLLLLLGLLADYTIFLLLSLCHTLGVTSYEEIGRRSLGKVGQILASTSIVMQNVGSMASYSVIVGDLLPKLLEQAFAQVLGADAHPWWLGRKIVVLFVLVVIVLPIALSRKIGWLGYASGLSVVFSTLFTVMVIAKQPTIPCPLPSETDHGQCRVEMFHVTSETFFVLPIIAFSFVCHTTLLPVYAELKNPTTRKMQNVSHVSLGLSGLLYALAAVFGYLSFRGKVPSDLLIIYGEYYPHDMVIAAVRVAIVASVVLTLPLLCFPCRKCLSLAMYGPGIRLSRWKHIALTIFILTCVALISLFVQDVKVVLGIAGASSSVMLVFVLPSLFYLKVEKGKWHSPKMLAPAVVAVGGLAIGVSCVSGIVVSLVNGH